MIIYNELLEPIKGHKLSELYSNYANKNFPSLISENPELALEKIELFFEVKPNTLGSNISAISEIRTLISNYSQNNIYNNAFSIVAPHTHWRETKPIVYSYDEKNNRYIVGPHLLQNEKIYRPVSFALSNTNIVAFEWIDCSVLIDTDEFFECMKIITMVNADLSEKNYPLGIALDFRFKNSLFETSQSTVEVAEEELKSIFYDFAYILKQTEFIVSNTNSSIEQVAWNNNDLEIFDLTKEEKLVLRELRKLISSVDNPLEQARLFNDLEKSLFWMSP